MMRYLSLLISIFISPGLRAQSGQPVYKDSAFVNALLGQHNTYRAVLQLPYLTWSDDLAADAKAWAVHLAAIGKGDHDQSIRGHEGENIWWGTAGAFSYTDMVSFWGSEKKAFVYDVFPNCRQGKAVVGHYTQVVWKNTVSVGCALASNGQTDYLVCRYSPAGNIIGQKPY
ncbi:MAG TPA: CAP domain-containing protein [Puia sp.]|nr:CAP domain-containing protein [Puia sp.]